MEASGPGTPGGRPTSAAYINQHYEGHGIAVPVPLDRGFPESPSRPLSAAVDTPERSSSRSRGRRTSKEKLKIHVHLREKVIAINAGEGNQRVFWLAVLAVQRYVTDPDSYTRTFSEELTPKGVLSAELEWIDNCGLIRNELADGAHVWIDVGDGTPISAVQSRPFGSHTYEPGEGRVEETISWEDNSEDRRQVMKYSRAWAQTRETFETWRDSDSFRLLAESIREESPEENGENGDETAAELLWWTFNATWKKLKLNDLPGFTDWSQEVQASLWRHFQQLAYIFSVYAQGSRGSSGANNMWVMSLSEFWKFCKERRIATPWLNLTKINILFVSIDSRFKDDPHNPRRGFVLHEFLEGIVRLSVLRQKDPKNPEVPFPECLDQFLGKHVFSELSDTASDSVSFTEDQQIRESLASSEEDICRYQLAALPARKIFNRHESAMRRIFKAWSKRPSVMTLDEWLELFKVSKLVDTSLSRRQLGECFVFSQLDEAFIAEEWKCTDDTCETLIFPEFEEALGRAALFKYRSDTMTSLESKLHEILELLIASPAGVFAQARPNTAPKASMTAPFGSVDRVAAARARRL